MKATPLPNPTIFTSVADYELSPTLRPTPPSLLWPGTEEAFRRQCKCPVGPNEQRLRAGERPILLPDCRVHNKVCQSEKCEHSDHLEFHPRCEHCTNMMHACVVCEATYLEDGDDPTLWGWVFVETIQIAGQVSSYLGVGGVRGWRCPVCRKQ